MTFFEARERFGMDGIPDCLAPYYEEFPPTPLIDRAWLAATATEYGVPAARLDALTAAKEV